MTKQELIGTLQREWDHLQSTLDGLDEEQMLLPGVNGDWSVKDVLAHIAAWHSHLITSMFKIEKGVKPDGVETDAEIDRLNAQFYAAQKDRPFENVWDDFESSYYQLLKRLETWSEEALFDPKRYEWMKGQPFARYVEGD